MSPIAVSLGDPAGVGPELVARAWVERARQALPPFFAVGSARSLTAVWRGPVGLVTSPDEALGVWDSALPIMVVDGDTEVTAGRPDLEGARLALASLELAVGLTVNGAAGAVMTGPVSKAQLHRVGFQQPGQTEFVAQRCGMTAEAAAMMLAAPSGLRVVPITTHVPLAKVPGLLTAQLIAARVRATVKGLSRNFGIEEPRLALAALNPHAGEDGDIGREELDVMIPAAEALRDEGIQLDGPLPADALFTPRVRARYDAILCPTHDQALIPFKALHVDDGVNMTLGLPIVRTSPDHGTAFDIAGTGQAHAGATVAAIRMAHQAAAIRLHRTA